MKAQVTIWNIGRDDLEIYYHTIYSITGSWHNEINQICI